MYPGLIVLLLISSYLLSPVSLSLLTITGRPPNILLIIVDDLKPSLGCYGDKKAFTPNIDKLAARGIRFSRAYAQQAVCGPSRVSLLTGRAPDTTRLYDFGSYWRRHAGNFTSMPQLFRERGYRTLSVGKVFHPGVASNHNDDMPFSWSQQPYHPPTQKFKNSPVCPDLENSTRLFSNVFCPVNVTSMPDSSLPDIQSTEAAIRHLETHNSTDGPLFLAVGLHKPHIPHKFPEEFLKYHPYENVRLPSNHHRPAQLPSVAWNPYTSLRRREDVARTRPGWPWGPLEPGLGRRIIQGYYSAVSYVDSLVGRLVEAADHSLENTIIVLTSDHGWSLGQHAEWAKMSNYEEALSVPLILVQPMSSARGVVTKSFSLVDLFPSLASLAGLGPVPSCPKDSSKVRLCTDGRDWSPLIDRKDKAWGFDQNWSDVSYSQYPRPSLYPRYDSELPKEKDIRYMGYSARWREDGPVPGDWRCTVWMGWNMTATPRYNFSDIVGLELYDHTRDEEENINLAGDKMFVGVIQKCMELIYDYVK